MPDRAEIVTRRFRIERGAEGEVERVYVEGLNAKGRRHWFLVCTGKQAGFSWLDVSWLLSIDLVVPPQALSPRLLLKSRAVSPEGEPPHKTATLPA